MPTRFPIAAVSLLAVLAQSVHADRATLLDGSTVQGIVARIDAEGIEIAQCGTRATYLRSRVRSIELDPANGCGGEASGVQPPVLVPGSRIVIHPSRPIDAGREPLGQVFGGTIEESVIQGEKRLIPKDASALLQLQAPRRPRRPAGAVIILAAVCLDGGWVTINAPLVDASFPVVPGARPEAAVEASRLVFVVQTETRLEPSTHR